MLQFLWFGRQVDTNSLKADYTRNWNSSYYDNPFWSGRRDPQALHGLVAFVEQIDRAEDGFALAPGIAGIDDLVVLFLFSDTVFIRTEPHMTKVTCFRPL